MTRNAYRFLLAALCIPLCGCVHAPAFNILGSYFPAWMLCGFVGIVVAVLFRVVVVRFKLEGYARPAVLTYPATAALVTFTLWLVFFT